MTDTIKDAITSDYLREVSGKLRAWPDLQDTVGPAHAATILTMAADKLDEAKAEIERLRSFIGEFATAVFPATRNFSGPHPADEIEATTPADYVHAFQDDALALLRGSSQ